MKLLEDIKLPLAVLIIAFVLLLASGLYLRRTETPISNRGFVEVKVNVRGQRVYLTSDCWRLSMVVSKSQALSIKRTLAGEISRRPRTHDLLKDVLNGYNIRVMVARVHSLEKNTYHANLYLRRREKILKLDSRPSDAIATALRVDAPVYMRKDLIENYGRKIC